MSRVIKKERSAELPALSLRLIGEKAEAGVHPLPLRRVDAQPRPQGAGTPGTPFAASLGADDRGTLEGLKRQAFQEGYTAGEQAAAGQAAQREQAAMNALGRMVAELASLKPRLRQEAERELVALSLAIARRIIRRELTVDPQTVLAIVRTCLQEFQHVEIQRLRVNPRDLELVSTHLQGDARARLEIVPDPLVSPGGAVFQTAQGQLDGRIETQLQEIEHGLADG